MWLGFLSIGTFMVLIMTRRVSALAALILVPLVFGLLAGRGPDLGKMAVTGVTQLAPTAALLLFAVLYFAVMIDVGLFDPLVRRVLAFAGDDPVRVAIGTAVVALIVSLDGDGSTTALITVSAFLPAYRRLGMNPLILATLLGLAVCVINLMPWGGPAGRAAAALHLDPAALFVPLLPTIAAGAAATLAIAWFLGRAERRRLTEGRVKVAAGSSDITVERDPALLRPRLFWINLALTLALFVFALARLAPLPLVFMVGLALALTLNYPNVSDQRARVTAHAASALPLVLLILAAGAFTGILSGTGMIDAMARGAMTLIPSGFGPWMGVVTAVISAPLTFALSNDALFFGVLPVFAQTAAQHGIEPAAIARASLLSTAFHGLSPLVPAVYLITGLVGRDLGALQRFALKWVAVVTLVMILAAVATRAIV